MDEGYGFYCSDPRGARVYDPLNQCYIDYQAHMEYELQRYHWNSRNRCFYPPCGCCENRWCQHHRQQVENRRTAQAVGSLIEVTTWLQQCLIFPSLSKQGLELNIADFESDGSHSNEILAVDQKILFDWIFHILRTEKDISLFSSFCLHKIALTQKKQMKLYNGIQNKTDDLLHEIYFKPKAL